MMAARVELVLAFAVLVAACSSPYEGETLTVDAPSETNFAIVAPALDYSCGSLDCHGSLGRNFRLYGSQGLRLSATDVPCGNPTTPAEVLADYRSAVALEPEVMAEVVESGGAHPERLTLIRKARGTESHKGGIVFPVGSPGDQCLVTWLSGTAPQGCTNVLPAAPENPVCTP